MANNSKTPVKPKKKTPLGYNFWYDFVKVTGALPTLLWMRPKIYYPFGKPSKKGAFLVISNHPTFLDPIIVHLAFPWRRMHSLATKDLFNTNTKVFFFSKVHCIIVDKENFSVSSFRQVVDCLDGGKVVVIFPEGRVHVDSPQEVLAFKSGAVMMAHRAGAPIIPMYIVKKTKWYQRQRIVMGQAIDVAGMLGRFPSVEQLNQVSDLLRENEVKLKEYFESLPICKKMKEQ